MRKYKVVLVTSDKVDVEADGFHIDSGSLVFYKNGIVTEDEKYPEDINIQAYAVGAWLFVAIVEDK